MGMQTDKVRYNVGGKIFETSATTLASARRSSMFGAMFDDEWNLQPRQVNEEYFIDRNPDCVSVLLNLLRTGELCVPPHVPDKLFYKEALYYGLLNHVRAARFRELDVNQLRLTSSVRGQASGGCNAIRVSPDGGCAVAHSRIVRTYDWMLEEYPPINFNYQKVNDIGWIDLENIVISACERSGRQDSGIGIFSSSSGNLKHTFQLNQVKRFTAGALCFNSDGKMFAACSETGINVTGVWDQVTGEKRIFSIKQYVSLSVMQTRFNASMEVTACCFFIFQKRLVRNIFVFWILEIKVWFGIIPQ
ncbi:BTB/POZ domain-containing protein At2g24240-like [Papaver somniferum]|uniref:BTB/POZ domain-containing protein At2g24240-like n=1 Tax=Papaver somniferum TaxID=3469 RepID=UPI000E6F5EE0|nr:BTB/POZ domain-containing protein At2g24240-like [Papaver somniferum]